MKSNSQRNFILLTIGALLIAFLLAAVSAAFLSVTPAGASMQEDPALAIEAGLDQAPLDQKPVDHVGMVCIAGPNAVIREAPRDGKAPGLPFLYLQFNNSFLITEEIYPNPNKPQSHLKIERFGAGASLTGWIESRLCTSITPPRKTW